MKAQHLITWISIAGIIGFLFGIFYAFFGLNGLPAYQKLVPVTVYTPWSNGLYGAVFIGFSVLLFLVGRHVIKTKDKFLMKALLYGIASWVDVFLMIFLGLPLFIGIHSKKS